jgi:LPS export ABC transporter protein LptC
VLRYNGLVVVFVATLLAVASCDQSRQGSVIDPALEAMDADYIMFGLTDYLTRKGIREAIVRADTAFFFQDSTAVLLSGNVRLTAYDEESGTEKALVTSDRGRLDTSTNSLLAQGNAVLIIQADGRRIESAELRYVPDQDAISSDSATVMYDGDSIIEGTGFDADLSFERVLVRNARTRGGAVRF